MEPNILIVVIAVVSTFCAIVFLKTMLVYRQRWEETRDTLDTLHEVANHMANRLMRYDMKVQFKVGANYKIIYTEDISRKDEQ